MPSTVFANSRGIVHKSSGGLSTVFPNVCKTQTPAGPVPIPYPSIGMASNTSKGPKTVKVDGQMPMIKDAQYATSSGDEPSKTGGGGLLSGESKGVCEFMLYSMDVMFDGGNVCRMGDPLLHNNKNGMG
jgi:hypothetical protein